VIDGCQLGRNDHGFCGVGSHADPILFLQVRFKSTEEQSIRALYCESCESHEPHKISSYHRLQDLQIAKELEAERKEKV
jgi:hypothetical protein